jgi:hypothetical protein
MVGEFLCPNTVPWSELTGNISNVQKAANKMSEKQFRKWWKRNKVRSVSDFITRFGPGGARPPDVPSAPDKFYGIPWSEFTGTAPGRRPSKSRRAGRAGSVLNGRAARLFRDG